MFKVTKQSSTKAVPKYWQRNAKIAQLYHGSEHHKITHATKILCNDLTNAHYVTLLTDQVLPGRSTNTSDIKSVSQSVILCGYISRTPSHPNRKS